MRSGPTEPRPQLPSPSPAEWNSAPSGRGIVSVVWAARRPSPRRERNSSPARSVGVPSIRSDRLHAPDDLHRRVVAPGGVTRAGGMRPSAPSPPRGASTLSLPPVLTTAESPLLPTLRRAHASARPPSAPAAASDERAAAATCGAAMDVPCLVPNTFPERCSGSPHRVPPDRRSSARSLRTKPARPSSRSPRRRRRSGTDPCRGTRQMRRCSTPSSLRKRRKGCSDTGRSPDGGGCRSPGRRNSRSRLWRPCRRRTERSRRWQRCPGRCRRHGAA